MALEWLKQEMRALWPQGQRWLASMRHELSRVQALHRRERARERLLEAELDNARAALMRWQARRDVAAQLPRPELAERAALEVQRHAAEVEAIQVVLAKQQALTTTLTEKLSAMESRFLIASERAALPRRPVLEVSRTLEELSVRERRFQHSEHQLLQQWPPVPGVARDPAYDDAVVNGTAAPRNELVVASGPAVDADFVTTTTSTDKPERAP